MNLYILLALISLLCFGVANVMQKPAIEKLGALKLITFRGYIVSIITFIVAIFLTDFSKISLLNVVHSIVLSIVSYFGLFFFSMGLKYSKPGIVIPISSSRIIFVTIFSFIFFNQQIPLNKYIFIFVILIGIILISINFKDVRTSFNNKGSLYALLAGFFWGITFPFFGPLGNNLGVFLFSFILEFTVMITSIFQNYISNGRKLTLPSIVEIKTNLKLLLVIGVLSALGSITLNTAYGIGEAPIISAISGCSVFVSVTFSRIYLKDKIIPIHYFAALVIVLGIVGISLS